MNPLTLKDTIKAFHKIGRPLCVEGSPGVGKTLDGVFECERVHGVLLYGLSVGWVRLVRVENETPDTRGGLAGLVRVSSVYCRTIY